MKLHIKRVAGLLSLALILSLFAGFSTPALAEDAYAMVVSRAGRLYENADLSGRSAKIEKYAIVTLVSASGGVSKVEYKGYTGYMDSSAIGAIDTSSSIEAVFAVDGRAYELATTSSKSVKVSAGTTVNVLLAANGCALIEKNGYLCYTRVRYLTAVGDSADPTPEPTSSPTVSPTATATPEPEVVYEEFDAIVTDASLKIYASVKSGAEVIGTLAKDTVVTVTAYTDSVARVSYGGGVGYCLVSGLTKYVAPDPTADDVFADSSLSNEEKIFYFLVYEMDFNTAGACGVLANIDCESGFRPTAVNSSSGAYGICQWLGGRKTNLQNYCASNGYDSDSLEGQLWFLKYELTNKYPSVLSSMKSVDDSAQGAYDAGYHWCYYFEIPGNRSSTSAKRGAIARDEFWPEYK